MGDFKDLLVYKKSFELAMKIYFKSQSFPKEERYSLTDQIRRSSRSVSVNIGEGYRKRIYPAYFKSKMVDCDGENTETQIWLAFAKECGYINNEEFEALKNQTEEIGKLLNHMIHFPEKYGVKKE